MIERMIRAADLAGTFVFAVQGGLAAIGAGFDPVGTLVLAFLVGLGGGVIRDVLIGATPPAAMLDRAYPIVVIAAAGVAWSFAAYVGHVPALLLTALDAAGLGLFATVGAEKALDRAVPALPAIFLGAISGVGGGVVRDVMLNTVPRVLYADIYATAAMLAAVIVVLGRAARLPRAALVVAAALACFALRMAAVIWGWQLPHG
jgi:uncharacterized membrane protein YeiH